MTRRRRFLACAATVVLAGPAPSSAQGPGNVYRVGYLNFRAGLAAGQRLPAMYEIRNFVDAGGLVSYGPDLQDMYRRAATYVDRIFHGAKPGDLAIEQPGKFEMVINMQAAKALGLTFPQSVLVRADEVIR